MIRADSARALAAGGLSTWATLTIFMAKLDELVLVTASRDRATWVTFTYPEGFSPTMQGMIENRLFREGYRVRKTSSLVPGDATHILSWENDIKLIRVAGPPTGTGAGCVLLAVAETADSGPAYFVWAAVIVFILVGLLVLLSMQAVDDVDQSIGELEDAKAEAERARLQELRTASQRVAALLAAAGLSAGYGNRNHQGRNDG